MASNEPFEQLVGKLDVYIAVVGSTVPDVDTTPTSPWVLMGATTGEQSLQHAGALTYFRDNDHQGPTKAVRPEEDVIVAFMLADLTLEDYRRILGAIGDITSDSGPPATKTMPSKRGYIPTEYALLFRGTALSPYGAFPGMYVVPRGVFDGEPTLTYGKANRAELECEFHALEDDDQASDDDKLGWLIVQTA